jgi:hypothetical protein
MQFTLTLGLEDLKSLPLELRQKVQQALDLPVSTPQPVAPVQPPVTQFVAPQPAFVLPAKQPQMVGNRPTFMPDMTGPTAMSGAVDVLTGQPVQFAPPVAPVMPQVPQTPVNVGPIPTQGPATPVQVPQADLSAVRGAAVRLANDPNNGRQRLAAAEAACGVKIAGLTPDNCGALALALRNVGVPI